MIAPSGCSRPTKKTPVDVRVEHAPEERQVVVGRGDQRRVEERERHLVARAVDDDVGLDLGAVGEAHASLGRARARFGFGVISPCARRERMSSETVGCASPKSVVGLAAARSAPCRRPSSRSGGRAASALADGERHPRGGGERVERAAEQVLRDHPRAAPRGEVRARRATNEDSTAMSIAELPMPSTTTSLVAEEAPGRRRCTRARGAARRRSGPGRGTAARASAGPSGGRWRRRARRRCACRAGRW